METGFARSGGDMPAREHDAGAAPWMRLRERLVFGWVTARAATEAGSRPALPPTPVAGGSFDCRSARLIAVYGQGRREDLGGVNPSALGNGKFSHDKDVEVAGAYVPGG